MKPHQAGVEISYDGTWVENAAGAAGSAASGASAYIVVKGDCLWNIAKRFYGSGRRYMEIYQANEDTIESTAKAHGKPDSYKGSTAGWWIWPGEVLTIPGITGENAKAAQAGETGRAGVADPRLGEKMTEQTTAFTYTDVANGQSDSVSVTMQDIGKEWLGELMPKRGAVLGAKILLTNWGDSEKKEEFDCGTFMIDDISFSGRPLSCVLGGVNVPAMEDFKSLPVTRTWEKTTIQDIAAQISAGAGMQLYYDAGAVQIAEIEQSKQTDSSFLYSLCNKYGLAVKVYNHKIVIYDAVAYEEKGAVRTIREKDTISWSCNMTVDGTYTGVNLNYTDPDVEDTIKVTMGSPGRMYAVNTQASGRYDAELQAAAKVNEANRGIQTMELTVRAEPGLVASQCIELEDFGNFDGKYFIDRIRHSLGNGYTMQISVHKVQAAVKATVPASTAGRGGQAYTVVSGDTLWGIARRFYGTGTKYHIIYDANTDLIESTAKDHGKKSSDNGHWIWPGEVLTIPEDGA